MTAAPASQAFVEAAPGLNNPFADDARGSPDVHDKIFTATAVTPQGMSPSAQPQAAMYAPRYPAAASPTRKGLTIALVVGGVILSGLFVVGFLVALLLPAVQAARNAARNAMPKEWITYTSPDGYTVSLPAQPQLRSDTQFGLTTKTAMVDLGANGAYYVAAGKIPFSNVPILFDKQAALDAAATHWVKSTQSELVSQNVIDLNGHLGREFVFSGEQSGHPFAGFGRVYFVDTMLYQLVHVGPVEKGSTDAQRFFNSFTVSREKTGGEK